MKIKFFNSENERDENFLKDLKEAGYIIENHSPGSISATKITETPITPNQEDLSTQNVSMPDKDYTLMSSGDNYIGEFLIRTLIYKQK
jgi:predicted HAD superfamily hydrolase